MDASQCVALAETMDRMQVKFITVVQHFEQEDEMGDKRKIIKYNILIN